MWRGYALAAAAAAAARGDESELNCSLRDRHNTLGSLDKHYRKGHCFIALRSLGLGPLAVALMRFSTASASLAFVRREHACNFCDFCVKLFFKAFTRNQHCFEEDDTMGCGSSVAAGSQPSLDVGAGAQFSVPTLCFRGVLESANGRQWCLSILLATSEGCVPALFVDGHSVILTKMCVQPCFSP
jgi:hypothetical protein